MHFKAVCSHHLHLNMAPHVPPFPRRPQAWLPSTQEATHQAGCPPWPSARATRRPCARTACRCAGRPPPAQTSRAQQPHIRPIAPGPPSSIARIRARTWPRPHSKQLLPATGREVRVCHTAATRRVLGAHLDGGGRGHLEQVGVRDAGVLLLDRVEQVDCDLQACRRSGGQRGRPNSCAHRSAPR